jgi:hypothetical protein
MLLRNAAAALACVGIAAALAGCQPSVEGTATSGTGATTSERLGVKKSGNAVQVAGHETGTGGISADDFGTLQIRATGPAAGFGLSGVIVQVNSLEHCYSEGPELPSNPQRFTEVETGPDGYAEVSAPPGCYGFTLLDHPDSVVPIPHGMHGAELEPRGTEFVEFGFTEGPNFEPPNGNETDQWGSVVVRASFGDAPVAGVRVGINRMDACFSDGPGVPLNPVRVAEVITGADGLTEAVTLAPGCYSFDLLDYPGEYQPVPHGMNGVELEAQESEVAVFEFWSV